VGVKGISSILHFHGSWEYASAGTHHARHRAAVAVIDQLLLLMFVVFSAPAVIILFIGLGALDYVRHLRCRNGRHRWKEPPVRGAGGIGVTITCRDCGAGYIRHRGF